MVETANKLNKTEWKARAEKYEFALRKLESDRDAAKSERTTYRAENAKLRENIAATEKERERVAGEHAKMVAGAFQNIKELEDMLIEVTRDRDKTVCGADRGAEHVGDASCAQL